MTQPTCPRILIVDDDIDHCQLVSDALMTYYHITADSRIVCVPTAQRCLEQTIKEYDVILLDLHLPDMDGLQVLEEILHRADLPVIFVTGEQDLATATQAIEKGAQDYIVKLGEYLFAIPTMVQKNIRLHQVKLENKRLHMRLEWMLQELTEKNRQLEESMEQLRTMATTDPLTGLANRRSLNEQLIRLFAESKRYNLELSCCMIDLDHYKQLNDTLGHQMGDEVLQIVADEIRSSLREPDIAARYGGDEFILLLPQTKTPEAVAVARRIRQRMADVIHGDKRLRVPVSLSVGIASRKTDTPHTPEGLVAMADRALYRAKDLGKDRVVVFSEIREQTIAAICPPGDSPEPHLPAWLDK